MYKYDPLGGFSYQLFWTWMGATVFVQALCYIVLAKKYGSVPVQLTSIALLAGSAMFATFDAMYIRQSESWLGRDLIPFELKMLLYLCVFVAPLVVAMIAGMYNTPERLEK